MIVDGSSRFLIRKTTGEIFSEVENKESFVLISRLGDLRHKKIMKHRVEEKYMIIEKEENLELWSNICIFIKKEVTKYDPFEYAFLYSSEDEIIIPTPIKKLNDPVYLEIDKQITELANQSIDEKDLNVGFFRENIEEPKTDSKIKTKLIKRKKSNNEEGIDGVPPKEKTIEFIIIEPDPVVDVFENVILHPDTRDTLEQVFVHHELKDFFLSDWSSNRINKNVKTPLNFYGPPGTGKTITAKSIANHFGQSILQVDFSSLMSKYMGDTGKNIQSYFKKAKDDNLVLLFDEADTLLQKRSSDTSSSSASYNNQNQTIFMQELDRFDGIIILTTNLFKNFDEAQLRRFRHIEFKLPTLEMRTKIIKDHIPEKLNIGKEVSFDLLAEKTEHFSGGDIKNLVENTLKNFATKMRKDNPDLSKEEFVSLLRQTPLDLSSFELEINKIKGSKTNYNGEMGSMNPISLIK